MLTSSQMPPLQDGGLNPVQPKVNIIINLQDTAGHLSIMTTSKQILRRMEVYLHDVLSIV